MANEPEIMVLEYKSVKIKVQEHLVANQTVYRVVFSDNRNPLALLRTTNGATRFWTSIPEGRQREAEEIGDLIAAHIKSKQ
jgi:hypothetical protein